MATEISRESIIFKRKVLKYKIEKNCTSLHNLIKEENSDEDNAVIYFNLWKLTGNTEFKRKAIAIYQKLFDKSRQYDYKYKLDQLNTESPV
jgi:hypothetical protein